MLEKRNLPEKEKEVRALDENDIKILKKFGLGPYV